MKKITIVILAVLTMLTAVMLSSCSDTWSTAVIQNINAITAAPQGTGGVTSAPTATPHQPDGKGYSDRVTFSA
ncbi:MAG: hypothetical protein P4L75_02145 [Clostridia bacterium]|nr:hypothetical protein [Clostridia bacterium]